MSASKLYGSMVQGKRLAKALALSLGILTTLIPSLVSPPALTAQEAAVQKAPQNVIRVGADIGLLATQTGPFWVPVFVRHDSDAVAVHIGLDYDELLMRFSDSWSFEGAVGTERCDVYDNPSDGYLSVDVPLLTAGMALNEEVLLIRLQFELRQEGVAGKDYGFRANTSLKVDGANTWFMSTQDQPYAPDLAVDGGIAIYFRNVIEVGSARISPNPQHFAIPVYVTQLNEETNPFSMGLDYDEVLLDLVNVSPFDDPKGAEIHTQDVQFSTKTRPGDLAQILIPFVNGKFPRMLRQHLFDLEFEYRLDPYDPPSRSINLVPVPGPDRATGGAMDLDVREGMIEFIEPRFIRGDADGSGKLNLSDGLAILGYLTGTLPSDVRFINCPNAMDANDDKRLDLSDSIYLLSFLYLGGDSIPAPCPEPGSTDPRETSLGCPEGLPAFELLPLPGY